MITFTVAGIEPVAQGSKKYVGNGVMIESAKNLKPWRQAISSAAIDARSTAGITTLYDGPCSLSVVFLFTRPKSHTGAKGLKPSAPRFKATKPDLDKCLRSTADALTNTLIRDDSQLVSITATKRYATDSELPGAIITIIPLIPAT